MAVVKLAKILSVVELRHLDEAMRTTAAMGCFQPVELSAENLKKLEASSDMVTLAATKKEIEDYAAYLQIDLSKLKTTEYLRSKTDLQSVQEFSNRVGAILRPMAEQERENQKKTEKYERLLEKLKYFLKIEFDAKDIRKLSFVKVLYGKISKENFERFERLVTSKTVFSHVLEKRGHYYYVLVLTKKAEHERTAQLLRELLFEEYVLPAELEGTPSKALESANKKLALLQVRREKIELERKEQKLLNEAEVQNFFDLVSNTIVIRDVQKEFSQTAKTAFVSGYLPRAKLDEYRNRLSKIGATTIIVDEEVHGKGPTLLNNFWLFKPFETLVEMFGRPSYHEIDPTPFLAISFLVMFGMMFGDIGHGFVLALGGILLRKKLKSQVAIPIGMGLSSMFFGVMYGDLFGFKVMHPPIWLDPMEETLHFLKFTAVLGVVLMVIGLGMNLINTYRARNFEDFFFSKNGITGIFMYLGTLFGLFVLGIKIGLWFILLVWVLPIILIFLKEPLGNLIKKKDHFLPHNKTDFIIGSFFELVDTLLGFLSNTISFVRIAAFAMNHIGLFAVVTLLTKMVHAGSYDGIVDGIIIVLGNAFIILLEGFIVTIQVLRLEYYEFFSKFFEAKGSLFKPLRLDQQRGA